MTVLIIVGCLVGLCALVVFACCRINKGE